MPAKVLDSFLPIAYFRDEPGAETMENLLVSAGKKDNPLLMTDVNYAGGEGVRQTQFITCLEIGGCVGQRAGCGMKIDWQALKDLRGVPTLPRRPFSK